MIFNIGFWLAMIGTVGAWIFGWSTEETFPHVLELTLILTGLIFMLLSFLRLAWKYMP